MFEIDAHGHRAANRHRRGHWRHRLHDALDLVARAIGRTPAGRPRPALFEPLEPRLLLSADPLSATHLSGQDAAIGSQDAMVGAALSPQQDAGIVLDLDARALPAATGQASGLPTAPELEGLLAEAQRRMGSDADLRIEVADLSGPRLARSEDGVILCAVESGYAYNGQVRDAELGIYYYKHRYYSPPLRSFLSPDPLGDVDAFDPYLYVGGDPLDCGLAMAVLAGRRGGPGWSCLVRPWPFKGGHSRSGAPSFHDADRDRNRGRSADGFDGRRDEPCEPGQRLGWFHQDLAARHHRCLLG